MISVGLTELLKQTIPTPRPPLLIFAETIEKGENGFRFRFLLPIWGVKGYPIDFGHVDSSLCEADLLHVAAFHVLCGGVCSLSIFIYLFLIKKRLLL